MALENLADKQHQEERIRKELAFKQDKMKKKIEVVILKTKDNEATGNYKERGRNSVGEKKRV